MAVVVVGGGGDVDVGFGGLFEREAAGFEGADDGAAGFERDEDVVGEVGGDEEDGAGRGG